MLFTIKDSDNKVKNDLIFDNNLAKASPKAEYYHFFALSQLVLLTMRKYVL